MPQSAKPTPLQLEEEQDPQPVSDPTPQQDEVELSMFFMAGQEAGQFTMAAMVNEVGWYDNNTTERRKNKYTKNKGESII